MGVTYHEYDAGKGQYFVLSQTITALIIWCDVIFQNHALPSSAWTISWVTAPRDLGVAVNTMTCRTCGSINSQLKMGAIGGHLQQVTMRILRSNSVMLMLLLQNLNISQLQHLLLCCKLK